MKIEVLFFGQLTDKTGCSKMQMDNPGSIRELNQLLMVQFPELANSKYTIALNNKIAIESDQINDHANIALMPPFSGG